MIVVVGAGLSGAAAARTLTEAGRTVLLLDKGRGVGGRLATRRVLLPGEEGSERSVRFDHGAPAVSGDRHRRFAEALHAAEDAGAVARWDGPAHPGDRVGVPSMRDLVGYLLNAQSVRTGVTVTALEKSGPGWRVHLSDGSAVPADAAILTVPAPQCEPLVAEHAPHFLHAAQSARYTPCWSAMLAFGEDAAPALTRLRPDALAAHGIEALIHNGAKPGRDGAATLVMHMAAGAAAARLEAERDEMGAWFGTLCTRDLSLPPPRYAAAHRWRYCRVAVPAGLETVYDAGLRLGVAGDWTRGPDAGDAYESGVDAAEALLSAD